MPLARILMTGIAKLLSKIFSMATLTFFGRLPTQDSAKISFMGLASLYWIYILLSVAFPDLAETFIPFLPDDDFIIRFVSISLALLLPLTVGFTSLKLENRDPDCSVIKQLIMGYVYSFILGMLSMILIILIPLIKLPSILKMHSQQQFAIMVRKGEYDDVLKDVKNIFEKYNIETSISDPKKPVWYCFIVLTYLLEHIFNRKIAKKMKYIVVQIEGKEVEVTVHATDITILGPKNECLQVKHILSEELESDHLYFSWDDSVQKQEDDLLELKNNLIDEETLDLDKLADITKKLRQSSLEVEDWNAIRRQIYKLERDYYYLQCEAEKATEKEV